MSTRRDPTRDVDASKKYVPALPYKLIFTNTTIYIAYCLPLSLTQTLEDMKSQG